MTPRGQPTTLQERLEIQARALAGQGDPEIARAIGRPLATVRKWRRRGQQQGRVGLSSPRGRPPHGALSTFPTLMRDTIRQLRRDHPGWGPQTILVHLAKLAELQGQPLPARPSIARYLRQENLARRYERCRELPQSATRAVAESHARWEIDAEGKRQVPDLGPCTVINLCDIYSKVKLLSYACRVGRPRAAGKPTQADYQVACRLAFLLWGRPIELASDRDSAFRDNTSASPYPTRLHLWLIGLGVDLVFGPPRRPTERATDERFHQTIRALALQGQTFATWTALQNALDAYRDFLNWELPCRTLDNQPPLVAYPEAIFSGRLYHPEHEAELLDLQRIDNYLAQGQWFRHVAPCGQLGLGGHYYGLGYAWANQTVEITFAAADRQLVFRSADGTQVKYLPIKGLTKSELMGELDPLVTFPAYQLALPFSLQEWRVIRLCETLGDTII